MGVMETKGMQGSTQSGGRQCLIGTQLGINILAVSAAKQLFVPYFIAELRFSFLTFGGLSRPDWKLPLTFSTGFWSPD